MKYYKPDITEFYVGFEYEEYSEGYTYDVKLLNPTELQVLSEPLQTTEWVKRVYELQDFVTFIDGELSEYIPEVRVKFLDEQDIKELGWEYKEKNHAGIIWFTGNESWFGKEIPGSPLYKYWEYELIFDSEYSSIKIECKTSNGDTDNFFEGIIKNKSELKKIMKQIGI